MGEAKRRNAQARQAGDVLRRRIAAGEFGPAGQAPNYCCVLDKSARGRDMLATLRGMDEFADVRPLLENESFQFWEASSLFRFVVLCGGQGRPAERVFVAADLERLAGEALPRAAKRLAGGAFGFVLAVADEVQAEVEAAAGRLRGG
ncbi:hypothetical protein [Caldimonas tepidiphila]|uniref:hypothetical protein n=1 Tax=Caldimonas tepidiphila TaxID=2315841 RepID=UPI000E5C3DF6|nr:hypothetical protein [Caldimonas tepidiphila]